MLLAAREGVELFQGHGFEIEPICLLWQSIFIDVYTIGTLNFFIERGIHCMAFCLDAQFGFLHTTLFKTCHLSAQVYRTRYT